MDLYKELLIHILEKEEVQVTFPNLQLSPKELVEMECYSALQKIKHILEDDTLNDPECFAKIEAIVELFEYFDCSCGNRHDF